jgi:carbonic anhydrase
LLIAYCCCDFQLPIQSSIQSIMFISRSALFSFLVTAAPTSTLVHAATSAAFSYDPTSDVGPDNWGLLPLDGNQCDGEKNSPIAVTTSGCTRYANYQFDVSSRV